MKCIDFDKQFETYMRNWVAKNSEKYNDNMDTIEAMMPEIYMEFLEKPVALTVADAEEIKKALQINEILSIWFDYFNRENN